MFRVFYSRIIVLITLISDIGITNKLSVHEKSKVRVLNFSIAAALPINVFFCSLNYINGKYLLANLDLMLTLGSVLILFLHKKQQFFLASLILICGASLLFFACSILYRNGSESAILALMITSVVIFENKKQMIGITLLNFTLFAIVKIFLLSPTIYDTVPKSRVLFNSLWSLFSVTLSLIYLRKEQDHHEKNIEKSLRELARMNNEKAKLFSIVAHDLRSPVGQLKTLIDLVNADHISIDTFKAMTVKLSLEADQLQGMMDNLLRWSMNQSQGIRAKPQTVTIASNFNEVMAFFTQNAAKKNIRLFQEESPFSVWADPDHLQLVLRNLVSNAIKYSRTDGVILLRSYLREKEIVIQVIDNGVGMTPDIQHSLFTTDSFVSRHGTSLEKGTGLGLKLCKEFVEKNNGRIWVDSDLNKGSTFSVALPATA